MPGAQSPGGADTEHSHPRRKATSTAPALTQRGRLGTSGVLWPRQGFRFYLSTFAKLGCVPWSTFLKKWNPSPCPFSEFLSPHPPPPPFLPPYVLYYFRQSSGATEEFQCMSGSSFSTLYIDLRGRRAFPATLGGQAARAFNAPLFPGKLRHGGLPSLPEGQGRVCPHT